MPMVRRPRVRGCPAAVSASPRAPKQSLVINKSFLLMIRVSLSNFDLRSSQHQTTHLVERGRRSFHESISDNCHHRSRPDVERRRPSGSSSTLGTRGRKDLLTSVCWGRHHTSRLRHLYQRQPVLCLQRQRRQRGLESGLQLVAGLGRGLLGRIKLLATRHHAVRLPLYSIDT